MAALPKMTESATLLNFPRAAQSLRGFLTAALKQHRLPDLLIEALVHDAERFQVEGRRCILDAGLIWRRLLARTSRLIHAVGRV